MTQNVIDLVLQARNGDENAFAKLHNQCHAKLYQYTSGLCYETNLDAEDVVQEALLQVWKKLGTLKEPKAFGSWTQQIATNRAKRYNAKSKREKKGKRHLRKLRKVSFSGYVSKDDDWGEKHYEYETYDPEQLSPMDEADRRETCEVVRRQIRRLPPLHQKVVEEYYFNGRTVAEIARDLNKPEGTVKRLLYEARQQLYDMLSPYLSF